MYKIFKNTLKPIHLARHYTTSLYGALKNAQLFDDVDTYCMFIGYSRSGKTMIASLLDAHPNIIIADELDALEYIHVGFSRRQIFYLLLENSRALAQAGRESKGYPYKVPGQWQGRFKTLRVIGDNKGGGSTLRLRAVPWLLQRLHSTIGVKVKFIHVIRNPYDNISAFSTRRNNRLHLENGIEHYFSLCESVTDIRKEIRGDDLFELRHESFITRPAACLQELCHYLGIEAPNDYLGDCASIVCKPPPKPRYEAPWNCELVDIVKKRIEEFPFLHGYSYTD